MVIIEDMVVIITAERPRTAEPAGLHVSAPGLEVVKVFVVGGRSLISVRDETLFL